MIVLRKSTNDFNSIENIFGVLMPFLAVKSVVLPFESKGLLNRFKNIRFLLHQQYSIIHITGHDHYLLWWPFKNVILTIHDIEALKRKSGLKKWLFKKLWFDLPIKNARLVTTISEFSKSEILSLSNYKTPIKVIHNPLALPLTFSPKAFNSKVPRILHLGTKENKNLLRTIQAIKGLSCHLTIIGIPDKALLSLLEENEMSHTIKSNLSQEQMIGEYNTCDLLSFVSTYEGFGLPILEAQAIGRPIITSNVASMPEVAGNGALLINPFSIKEIKEGILKIINDGELRDSLIAHGLSNARRFNPSTIAKQYTDMYNKVLND